MMPYIARTQQELSIINSMATWLFIKWVEQLFLTNTNYLGPPIRQSKIRQLFHLVRYTVTQNRTCHLCLYNTSVQVLC